MNAAAWAPWAAAAVGVQVGAAIVATRFVVGELGPATLAGLRYAIGLTTLLPFVLAAREPAKIAPREWPRIALLGIGQFALLIALLNIGLQTLPAAKAALLFACFPLLTLLVAAALGHERLSLRKSLGGAFTLGGVTVALGPQALVADAPLWGELAVLGSALCGAVCSVLYRPVLRRHAALPMSVIAMAAAVLFLALWAQFEEASVRVPNLSTTGWAAVVFIGTSSGIGYFLWLWALRHAPASKVTLYLSLSPLTAMLLGGLLLHEPLAPALIVALLLVVLGCGWRKIGGHDDCTSLPLRRPARADHRRLLRPLPRRAAAPARAHGGGADAFALQRLRAPPDRLPARHLAPEHPARRDRTEPARAEMARAGSAATHPAGRCPRDRGIRGPKQARRPRAASARDQPLRA